MEELQYQLDTLINFRNLSITIEVLYKNNIKLNEKVNDITARLNQLLDIKEDVENLKIKSESTQNRINLLQDSVNHFSDTLLKYEERFTEMNDKLNSYDTTIEFVKNATEDNMKKVLSHEDNLNNLNRVVEDQIKSLEKEKGNIENNRLEIEKLKELIDNYNNEINKLDTKIIENNNKIAESLNDISNKNTDNINNINIKIRDLNSNISNLANNINQLNSKTGIQSQVEIKEIKETPKIENKPIKIEKIDNTNIEGDTIINTTTNDNTIITRNLQRKISNPLNKIEHIPVPDEIPDTLTKDDIDFIYNKIKSYDKINQATKVHYDKELNNLNQKLIQLQTIIKKQKSGQELFDNNIPPITNNISMIEEPSTIPDININKGSDDVLKKVSETLRMFSNSIENKASLKKLDELNSNVDKKIKALGDKFQNAINILENKYKLGNQMNNNNKNEGENNNNNFDYDILVQNINVEIMKKIEENIKDMVQNKIDQFDLTSNPNIENLNKILEEHKDELDKAFESIVDIRNNLLSKKVQEDLTGLLKKVEDSDEKNRKLRFDLDKLNKLLEGEVEENKEGESNKFQGSFRENISFLGQKIAELQNNFNELKSKVDNMNKEILIVVKRDLKNESQRILDEFKSDLRLSISKIEEQLRDKVDKFGLAEFGQKMNNRIGNEMSRKIDKNDMSKNNMYISRKIDNLENKISRTLVDTLIDLQLDEAPLMTKKNLMGNVEKCASCNQPLPQNQGYYMINKSLDFNNFGNRNSGFKSKYVIKESEKLPEIK